MPDSSLIVTFDGGDAAGHTISMRRLGESLVGIERLASVGLMALETGQCPSPRQALPLTVRASPLRHGSVGLEAVLAVVPGFLPLVNEVYLTGASEVLWRWISGALLKMGGRENDSSNHFERLVDLLAQVDGHRHLEAMEWHKLAGHGRRVVAPIGSSCESAAFTAGGQTTEVDLPMADAIRSGDILEVGDMETMQVKVDGFTHHNRQLKLLHNDAPGRFITGHVRDPAFESAPNVYTEAATNQGWLKVTAKPTRKDGRLQALYIMDAEPIAN